MNGRDRALAAIRREPADRVAVGAMAFGDGVSARIRQLLGAAPDADVNQCLGVDFAGVGARYIGPEFPWKPPKQRMKFFGSSDKSYADGIVDRPLRRASSMRDVERFRWPTAADYDFTAASAQLEAAAGRAVMTDSWTPTFGDVSAILPDLVEIGLDVLEPTQAHLPGMQPEWLKREFGRHLTFFGGISTQTTLPFGTPDDVGEEVRERIRVLGAGGGYIVSPDHTVLDNVPAENVLALYREAGSLPRKG